MVYRKATDKLLDWNINSYPSEVVEASLIEEPYETSNLWEIEPVFDKIHSAVFPPALCERVIRYYSFAGDLVLDPFAGSGTTGLVADALRRSFFLIEQSTEYYEYMKGRFKHGQGRLFADTAIARFLTAKQVSGN